MKLLYLGLGTIVIVIAILKVIAYSTNHSLKELIVFYTQNGTWIAYFCGALFILFSLVFTILTSIF
tara:strand:- start:57 stop:254 length:198 start_codon:yes stop_codon:yes gene_type:complete